MKSSVGGLVEVGHVWSGIYLPGVSVPSSSSSSASASATTTSTAVSTAAPLSCVNDLSHNKEYASPSGGLYLILCKTDYGVRIYLLVYQETYADFL